MPKTIHIIVVETSHILYEGLIQVIAKSDLSFHFKQAKNLSEVDKYLCANPESLVIINPALIQYNPKEFHSLKNGWDKVRWVALIYQFHDQETLSLFDGTINISDTPGIIISTIKKVLADETTKKTDASDNLLSDREIEVLQLLAVGLSNKEVADKLNISINTAITHRKNISQKTGIKTVSGLTIYAVVNKLITLDSTN